MQCLPVNDCRYGFLFGSVMIPHSRVECLLGFTPDTGRSTCSAAPIIRMILYATSFLCRDSRDLIYHSRTSAPHKGIQLPLQEAKHIRDQIPVGNRMIQTDGDRHEQSAVFLAISPPVDKGREKQEAVR